MKQIQSVTEGVWKEIVKVELTAEEKVLMRSKEDTDKEAKKALMARIKSERELPLDETSSSVATEIYTANKPTLKETDKYQLIAVDISLDETSGVGKGIINCRVNDEHIQVRF